MSSRNALVFYTTLLISMPLIALATSSQLPGTSSSRAFEPQNLFKEYMTKGLYQCTSKYVHTLTKLQALIKEAFEEYTECERLLKESPGKKPTEVELLDRLLAEMDEDEEDFERQSTESKDLPNETIHKTSSSRQTRSLRARRSVRNLVAKLP